MSLQSMEDKLVALQKALEASVLSKGLEAGYRIGSPGTFTQGAALQRENLSPIMYNATYTNKQLLLTKELPELKATSTTVEYNRQLSYGVLGSSATLEVSAGQDNTGDYVRDFMPVKFYTVNNRVSFAAGAIQSFDGKNNVQRESENAAMKIIGDQELDYFRGQSDFSNGGVFDGNPLAIPQTIANMRGIDIQVRQSDNNINTQDFMLAEYGNADSNIIFVGGVMSQSNIEDAQKRSVLNFGLAENLYSGVAQRVAYNKATQSKERIVLAGTPQVNQGATIGTQWVTNGAVQIHSSVFLDGKSRPPVKTSAQAPSNPTIALAQAAGTTTFKINEVYSYYATAQNETGESLIGSAISNITIAANGNFVTVTITPPVVAAARWFNVYRSVGTAGATSKANMKFIGRVANSGLATTAFIDLNNKVPGSATVFLLDKDGLERHMLIPFEATDAAIIDTSMRKIFYSFGCGIVKLPRKSALLDSVTG